MSFQRIFKFIAPIGIIIVALLAAKLIAANKPEPKVRPRSPTKLQVSAVRLSLTSYPVIIHTQGSIQPAESTTLVSEVSGKIVSLASTFVVGGRFQKGDVLAVIASRDYQIALQQARANLAQASAQTQEQLALAEHALVEWKLSGQRGNPSKLTLREPQLAAAKANQEAAQALVQQAELDWQRTRLEATYEGMVSERLVDVGQFVAKGAALGTMHTIDAVQVRLPLSNRQLTYLDTQLASAVELSATVGSATHMWPGTVQRVEGLDSSTQLLNVIAHIPNPFATQGSPLRIGQFVEARIEGQALENVFVIPRTALREEREVLLVNDQGEIERRQVTIAWSDEKYAAISKGLKPNELLITSTLSTVTEGTPVQANVEGESLPNKPNKRSRSRKPQEAKD